MEKLLKLIEKGWKVFGLGGKVLHISKTPDNMIYFDMGFTMERCYTLRELTSKESGLWQFVCENGYNLYKKNYYRKYTKHNTEGERRDTSDFEYFVLESALCDEGELEDFILDNVKIDG